MPAKTKTTKQTKEATETKKVTKKPKKTVKSFKTKFVSRSAPKKNSTKEKIQTPYFRFMAEKRPELKGTLKDGEKVNKKLSELWNAMSEEDKKPYFDAFKKEKEEAQNAVLKLKEERKEKLLAARKAAKEKKE